MFVPVKVTEHLAFDSEQVVELSENELVEVNVTVPVGVNGVPAAVSVTIAVQVDCWLITIGVAQVIEVEVDRGFTVIVVGELWLLA